VRRYYRLRHAPDRRRRARRYRRSVQDPALSQWPGGQHRHVHGLNGLVDNIAMSMDVDEDVDEVADTSTPLE
jgi:hypothetical protein